MITGFLIGFFAWLVFLAVITFQRISLQNKSQEYYTFAVDRLVFWAIFFMGGSSFVGSFFNVGITHAQRVMISFGIFCWFAITAVLVVKKLNLQASTQNAQAFSYKASIYWASFLIGTPILLSGFIS